MTGEDADTLVVVRGGKGTLDPNYACIAHDGCKNRYALLGYRGGSLVSRDVYAAGRRKELEDRLQTADRGGVAVHADRRTDRGLLALRTPRAAVDVDLTRFRRAKSTFEIEEPSSTVRTDLRSSPHAQGRDGGRLRGAARQEDLDAVLRDENAHFVQYRAGFRDGRGRVSDLTRVEPKTPEWRDRLERVYRGLHSVRGAVVAGARVDDLNAMLRQQLRPQDVLLSDVVTHTGFESEEDFAGPATTRGRFSRTTLCASGARSATATATSRSSARARSPCTAAPTRTRGRTRR